MPKSESMKKWKTREFWKGIFTHNLSIKILSVIGAVLIWLLIVNIDNPYKTKSFIVQVDTINEEALRSVNKVYEIVDGSTATVNVTAKRSVVDNLEPTDIRAVADLSELSAVNSVAIKVSLNKKVSSDVVLECNQVMKVSLEDMETKLMKVVVETTGTPAEGYLVGECKVKPGVVEVTGGESAIDRITTVRVSLNVNGASDTFSKKLEPAAYDKNGNRVNSSTLSFSTRQVKVQAKMLQSKEVPVKVKVSGVPAEGYEFAEASCLPETVEIAGAAKKLSSVSEIEIPVDITGMTDHSARLEQELLLSDYLEEGITLGEEYQSVTVTIVIEALLEREVTLEPGSIRFRGLANGYKAEIVSDKPVSIVIRAPESAFAQAEGTLEQGYVDCSDLGAGTFTMPVKMDLGNEYLIIRRSSIKVRIEKAGGSAGDNSASDNSDGDGSDGGGSDSERGEPDRTDSPSASPKASEPAASPSATDASQDQKEEEKPEPSENRKSNPPITDAP